MRLFIFRLNVVGGVEALQGVCLFTDNCYMKAIIRFKITRFIVHITT